MGCGTSRDAKSVHPKKDKKGTQDFNSDASDDESYQSRTKPIVVFVLGGPGSGKGTQCERIVKEYGFIHFSVGDLLRAEKASGSKTAKLIDEYIAEGKLVPSKIPVRLIKNAMKKAGWEKKYYLIDGFPRNQENIDAWEKIFKDHVDVKFTLYYDCSLESMEKRIMERAKTSGRSDDNPEAMKKRFQTYQEETKPVVAHFEQKGVIRTINAEREIEDVFTETKRVLDTIQAALKATQEVAKPKAIFVLGGPGSGKGTQCEKIVKDFGLKHLSVGDLLREETKTKSSLAQQINEYVTQGKLVPSEIPVKLLKQAIDNAPTGTNFLVDGFPRNQENISEWNRIVGQSVEIKKILFYECSLETMEKRILERAKTSGRSDDNVEALKKRFHTYQQETEPVIQEYTRSNTIAKINAERDVDQVYDSTRQILRELL